MATFRIKGIISAERACECCGNTNLKKNVVLENVSDGSLLYVGTTCAGYLMLGKRSQRNSKVVEAHAKATAYAEKWVAVYGNADAVLQKIADAIRVHYCGCSVVNGQIVINAPTA